MSHGGRRILKAKGECFVDWGLRVRSFGLVSSFGPMSTTGSAGLVGDSRPPRISRQTRSPRAFKSTSSPARSRRRQGSACLGRLRDRSPQLASSTGFRGPRSWPVCASGAVPTVICDPPKGQPSRRGWATVRKSASAGVNPWRLSCTSTGPRRGCSHMRPRGGCCTWRPW